jgi:tRNA nucleotidyltransferase (CCA-adding enzyme)
VNALPPLVLRPAPELTGKLVHMLPATLHDWLQQAASLARAHSRPIYLVGGPVRDLMLDQPVTDLDLVIEGDIWPIAEAFASTTGGKVTYHAAFRTAAVELIHDNTPFVVDFVTARRETYPAPAALPVVEPSHILDDLHRRDFTINTLALRLDPPQAALLDPYGGQRDLEARLVRVLHDRSFIDDPTRILRAARFAARLRFTIEPHTRRLIEAALADRMLERTSAQRTLNELWLLLDEPEPQHALRLLHELGALPQLGLIWSDEWPRLFAAGAARLDDATDHDIRFGLLVWPLNTAQRRAFVARYNLPAAKRKLLDEVQHPLPSALAQSELNAVELERLLQPYSPTTLRVWQLVEPTVADHIARYLDTIKPLPPLLAGADLQARGVPPGPIYRQLLSELRTAQLAGAITTREAALQWLEEKIA